MTGFPCADFWMAYIEYLPQAGVMFADLANVLLYMSGVMDSIPDREKGRERSSLFAIGLRLYVTRYWGSSRKKKKKLSGSSKFKKHTVTF